MNHPLLTSTDVIRHAIGEQVRALGGTEDDVENIAFAASYAVMCWGFAATESS